MVKSVEYTWQNGASGSLGFGTYFNGDWFRGDWQPHHTSHAGPYTLAETVCHRGLWSGLRIHFHCGNLPIVQAWARQSAKHPDLKQLLLTLFLVAAQHSFTIASHTYLAGRKALLMPFPEIIYPKSHITSPRPEPLSPVATDQSLGPIYRNHLPVSGATRVSATSSSWSQSLARKKLLHCLQPSSSPYRCMWHLHHFWVHKPCFQELDAETCHPGCPTPPGAHSPLAHMTATDSGNAGSRGAEVGDRRPEKTRLSDAQGSPYLWVLRFRCLVEEATLISR